jgi:hypothetical protein
MHVCSAALQDYGNPRKWADVGFAAFIVSVCMTASLNHDDGALKTDATRTAWFELFTQLRALPGADYPSPYTVQALTLAATFGFGANLEPAAFRLLAEAAAGVIGAGMHQSADQFDWFDAVEDQVRKRTFWAVYVWDKHVAAHYGHPPRLRLRDTTAALPAAVDDDYITPAAVGAQPPGAPSRLQAFVSLCELAAAREAVLAPPSHRTADAPGSVLARATALLAPDTQNSALRAEDALADAAAAAVPVHWQYSAATLASGDLVRIMLAERLHCFAMGTRMLVHRRRLSTHIVARGAAPTHAPKAAAEYDAIRGMYAAASELVAVHPAAARHHGLDVVHQLEQCVKSLFAVQLESRHDGVLAEYALMAVDALRPVYDLLRHYAGTYANAQRSCDMIVHKFECASPRAPARRPR